jgi:DNA-binding transcriptional ArsR family regulator
MQRDSIEPPDDRFPGQLAAELEPKLQDALDHPVRRELLRILNRSARSQGMAELRTELSALRPSQLRYHLQVLRRSELVAASSAASNGDGGGPRFASEVVDDGDIRVILRATEGRDRERKETLAAAGGALHLTMFRIPRPVHTIRLGGRARARGDRSSG